MKYKVLFVYDEIELEKTLNEQYQQGWKFNSLETEYTKYIVIFEKAE